MADLSYKASGLVSYSDGSYAPFEAVYYNGTVYGSFDSVSLETFGQLYTDDSTNVDAVLALLSGTHAVTVAAPTTAKTVTDFTMEVSGLLARDDNTWEGFAVQYSLGSVVDLQESGTAYAEAIADSTFLAAIDSALEILAGTGNITITP